MPDTNYLALGFLPIEDLLSVAATEFPELLKAGLSEKVIERNLLSHSCVKVLRLKRFSFVESKLILSPKNKSLS